MTAGGFEVGDSDLDLEGVDALLADLPRFTGQLLALREQLAAEAGQQQSPTSFPASPVLITTEMFDGAPLRVEQHGGRPVILWNFEIKGVEDMVTALDGATSGHAAEVTR